MAVQRRTRLAELKEMHEERTRLFGELGLPA